MRAALLFVCIAATTSAALSGQQTSSQTPTEATITTDSTSYRFGQTATFTLRLHPAPRNLGGAEIICNFQYSGSEPDMVAIKSTSVRVPTSDGVAEYQISLRIGSRLKPGTWELSTVVFGRYQTQLSFQPVPFEILPPLPLAVTLKGPATVAAGTQAIFRVTLAKPIEVPSCEPRWSAKLNATFSRVLNSSPEPVRASVPLFPSQVSYEISFYVTADAPTGEWEMRLWVQAAPSSNAECPTDLPPIEPDALKFNLVRAPGVVVPTSAEATLNPSQIQLLRDEATLIRLKQKTLKGLLAAEKKNPGEIRLLLTNAVEEARRSLGNAESHFSELAERRSENSDAAIFFGDLKISYDDALAKVKTEMSGTRSEVRSAAQVNVAFSLPTVDWAGAKSAEAANVVLITMTRNANAYDIVADQKNLNFDLEVKTEPEGATVSYHRKGDQPVAYKDPTTCTIKNLVRAIWYVRLEKPDFKAEEKAYDANSDSSGVLSVKLRRQK